MKINGDDLTESREAAYDAEVPIPLTRAVKLPVTPVRLEFPPNSHLGLIQLFVIPRLYPKNGAKAVQLGKPRN